MRRISVFTMLEGTVSPSALELEHGKCALNGVDL